MKLLLTFLFWFLAGLVFLYVDPFYSQLDCGTWSKWQVALGFSCAATFVLWFYYDVMLDNKVKGN